MEDDVEVELIETAAAFKRLLGCRRTIASQIREACARAAIPAHDFLSGRTVEKLVLHLSDLRAAARDPGVRAMVIEAILRSEAERTDVEKPPPSSAAASSRASRCRRA